MNKQNSAQKVMIILFVSFIIFLPPQVYGKKVKETLQGSIDDLALQIVKSMVQAKVSKIAILPFKDLNSEVNNYGIFVAEELTTRIFLENRFEVIERKLLDQVLSELAFHETALVDPEATKKIGKLLGVDAILTGTVTDIGDQIVINARIVGTETGQIFAVARTQITKNSSIANLMKTYPPKSALAAQAKKVEPQSSLPPNNHPSSSQESGRAESNLEPSGMVLVSAGEFTMGSNTGYQECKRVQDDCAEKLFEDERPAHNVYLDSYSIDMNEITNSEYDQCVNVRVCTPKASHHGFMEPRQPVVGVTWYQAKTYCEWKGERLPTEAEWEKAARGSDGRIFPWGGRIDCNMSSYSSCNLLRTYETGTFKNAKSPYGLMDMAGNAREWVTDWYSDDYYRSSPKSNPQGPPSGQYRVLRGGAYNSDAALVRTTSRTKRVPDGQWDTTGFRCAKSVQ